MASYHPFRSSLLNSLLRTETFVPCPNLWVRLRDSLSTYGFEEALLLCEEPDGRWVAWVPDLGETILHRHQFTALL